MGLKLPKVSKMVGKDATKVIKKVTNTAIGAGSGFLTSGGSPIGALAGGISGSQRKTGRPLTFRDALNTAIQGGAYGGTAGALQGTGLFSKIPTVGNALGGIGKATGLGNLFNNLTGKGIGSGIGLGNMGNPLSLAAGSGLLAAGLSGNEAPETFNQPGALDSNEQAQLDAYAKAQQEAIGRGQTRLFGDIANQRNAFQTEQANLENPMLLEQAKQIRNALGSHIQSGGGTEGSGALGEALARAQERMANQRRLDSLNAFLPLTQQATGLGLQQELAPTEVQGVGLNRLFGQRDLMAERKFAADQFRKQRQAELRQSMIGAGGNILAGGLGGQGSLFGNPPIPKISLT